VVADTPHSVTHPCGIIEAGESASSSDLWFKKIQYVVAHGMRSVILWGSSEPEPTLLALKEGHPVSRRQPR
jgi:hypothetical protein